MPRCFIFLPSPMGPWRSPWRAHRYRRDLSPTPWWFWVSSQVGDSRAFAVVSIVRCDGPSDPHFVGAGNLQGPYNPVQNDSGSDACVVVMAKVFIGPPELSSNRHPGFTFGNSASRQADEPEFECRLASQQANSAVSPQLHDWQPCRSPANYRCGGAASACSPLELTRSPHGLHACRNLADGAYEFAVRGAGEEMVDVRPFVVDTSPPVLSMLESPEHVAVTPDALFRFTAADESSVEFECQLQLADGAQEVPGSLSGISNPGHWESCSSPVKVALVLLS